MWPYVEELFTDDELFDRLEGIAPRPSTLRAGFDETLAVVFAEAELEAPTAKPAMAGGRKGRHSTQLGYILAELQWLPRRHPGAKW